ncbi:MAG TPA: hypothetical protein VHR42_09095 [Clostridia bacterium]|nr:hypothetical protein [Clostridia bacterium]
MVLECWVIILILGIAAYMFVRGGRKIWASGVLPLMLVPFADIIYSPIGRRLARHSVAYSNGIRLSIYGVLFIIVSIWVILWAKRLPSGKSKYTYIIISIGFTLTLILLFIKNLHVLG